MVVTELSDYYSPYTKYADQAGKSSNESKAEESNKENGILEQMRDKYPEFEISSGNFSQGRISAKNKGFQGVTVSPAYLAKAESNGRTAKDLEEMLGGVESAYNWLKNAFARDGLELVSCGYFIDDKGKMGSYSVVKKKDGMFEIIDRMNEEAEKIREKKKAQKDGKKSAEQNSVRPSPVQQSTYGQNVDIFV